MKQKTIGLQVKTPSKICEDRNCPFHGTIKIRGRLFTGTVVSKDTHKTAKIKWQRQQLVKKYERFEQRISKLKTHNPKCIDANIGDIVLVAETRPISKTKKSVIVEVLKK